MAIRIKTENYALVVEDTADTSNPLMYLPKSQTWYNEENLDQGYVKFYGTTGTNEDNVRLYSRFENNFSGFLLSECVDGDDSDTAFTASTFRAWCGAKLVGFNNAEQTALSKHGFIDYNDTTGDVTLVADTWTDVPNNGAVFDLSTLTTEPKHWWRMGDGDTYPNLQDSGTEANCIFVMNNMTSADIVSDVP
jgi:hypothetical protein